MIYFWDSNETSIRRRETTYARWVKSENERNSWSCWNGAVREEGGTTTYQLLWHEELGRHFHFISLCSAPHPPWWWWWWWLVKMPRLFVYTVWPKDISQSLTKVRAQYKKYSGQVEKDRVPSPGALGSRFEPHSISTNTPSLSWCLEAPSLRSYELRYSRIKAVITQRV